MLTVINEEPEGGANIENHIGFVPNMFVPSKSENVTFPRMPRRSRCIKSSTLQRVDWNAMLARATEQDRQTEVTHPPESSDSEDSDTENRAPETCNGNIDGPLVKAANDLVLDLSSSVKKNIENKNVRKGYTLPSYNPQYRNEAMRCTPLKEPNSAVKTPVGRMSLEMESPHDAPAKKSLFNSGSFVYEKKSVSKTHIEMAPTEITEASKSEPVIFKEVSKVSERYEISPNYGHSTTSGFFSQPSAPSHIPRSVSGAPPLSAHSKQQQEAPATMSYDSLSKPNYGGRHSITGHQFTSDSGYQPYTADRQPRSEPRQLHTTSNAAQSSCPNTQSQNLRIAQPGVEPVPSIVFAVPDRPHKYRSSHKEIVVNGKPYQILALLGKGGSSKVYLVLAKDNSLLAIKCVNLANVDEKTKRDHLNEIEHLMKMQYCKHIIRVIDHQYLPPKNLLYAVMERGDTDLSRILKERTTSGEGVPPEMILFYWSEILLAVKSIHDNNIIHRDLKPANFLLVGGRLKLIDFGIASGIESEQTSVFKDSQSGTPNYMSPEAYMDLGVGDHKVIVRIGRKSDVWSLGCILYTFLYGKTPFQEYHNPIAKLHAITNPNHTIPFPKVKGVPDMLIESCRKCLIYDKDRRASIEELLAMKSQILMTPVEVVNKLRLAFDDASLEKAKEAIMKE